LPKPGSTSAGRGPHRDDNAAVPGLRALLDRLPAEERDIIALAFYGGLNHAQIAELLGLAPGTVKGRMRLGLHKLRGIMDEGQQADENPSG
jgi:RNA polymerase sigma-70 factor (ECF subfamily)